MAATSNKTVTSSNTIIIRCRLENERTHLGTLISVVGNHGGLIGAIDIIRVEQGVTTRDITVQTADQEHADAIVASVDALPGVTVVNVSDRTFLMHLGGKIEVVSKTPIKTRDELSMAYTPGVARVCMSINEDKERAWKLTIKRNTVAVISDGTAVLGLGDIGPEAAMPVMEGKAMLFKDFGGVDAFPLCLDTTDTEEIIRIVKALAPTFGGVNLEDISAPRCFEIERRLQQELDIPIFHDDQHGTAVVMTAALINALRITKKEAKSLKVVVVGVGAAGTACTKMMRDMGVANIIGCDRRGALSSQREDLNGAKKEYLEMTNPHDEHGTVHDVIKGADVFVGLSGPGIIDIKDIRNMNEDRIVFAMANPTPEIMPEECYEDVAVMATGRSDYPNQINNVLCFPGIFKGALQCRATTINEEMKLAAAQAIADTISPDALSPDYIVPSVFDKTVARNVGKAVMAAAKTTGVARTR